MLWECRNPVDQEPHTLFEAANGRRLRNQDDACMATSPADELCVETPKVNLILGDEDSTLARRKQQLRLVIIASSGGLSDGHHIQARRP